MRFICAAAMIAMLTSPVHAQSQVKGQPAQPPAQGPKSQKEIEAERAAEQAYKKSLGNIPDQPAADPWGNARRLEDPNNPAKTAPAKPKAKTGTAN
jgi:hypothetical protein